MLARSVLAGCFAAFTAVALAQNDTTTEPQTNILDSPDTTFTFTDCAAPDEMKTCWNAHPVDTEVEPDAICAAMEQRAQCALTNCWNRVYSCDYQLLMLQYNMTCTDDVVPNTPFFPAPANAAAACSCNLSNYMQTIYSVSDGYGTCAEVTQYNSEDEDDEDDDDEDESYPACDCCFYGAAAAAMYDVCPDTNPNILGLNEILALYVNADNNTAGSCPSVLSSYDCASNGFDSYGINASSWAQATLPHSATGSLTDLSGSITSPVSGATYTWTALNGTYTITAASVEAMATRTASATGSATGKANGTSTLTVTATKDSSSSGEKLSFEQRSVVAFAAFAGAALAIL